MMESLEERKLLSATLRDGLLYVKGTAGNDNIEVSVAKSPARYRVLINGETSSFTHLNVGSIKIYGAGGNDKITFYRDGIKDPVTALGGPGRDTVRGIKDGQTYIPAPKFNATFAFGEDRLDGVLLYAKDFGAVGDGITNDAPAIQAAIDAAPNGATVVLEPGATYLLRTGLFMDRPVNIEGRGAKLLMKCSDHPQNRTIWIQSRHSDISYEWMSQVVEGQTIFPVANATDISVGDVVFLELGQDPYDPAEQHYAGLARVLANDGVNVTLETPVPHAITQGAFAHRLTRVTSLTRDISIRNLQFDHVNGTVTDAQLWIQESENVTVENVTGRFTILLLAADSTGVVLRNAFGDLAKTHRASGRVINGWQSEIEASNIHVRTFYDEPVVFLESWNRGLTLHGLEVRWEHWRETFSAVFHITGGSNGNHLDDVSVYHNYKIILAAAGAQTGSWEFGKLMITGGATYVPVTYDVTYKGLRYANLQTVVKQIVLQPNMIDVFVPLFKGLLKSLTVEYSSEQGTKTMLLENSRLQQVPLSDGIGVMGSDYPFIDPLADDLRLHIYRTGATLPPGTTLTLTMQYVTRL